MNAVVPSIAAIHNVGRLGGWGPMAPLAGYGWVDGAIGRWGRGGTAIALGLWRLSLAG
jgi:hypothetical protein